MAKHPDSNQEAIEAEAVEERENVPDEAVTVEVEPVTEEEPEVEVPQEAQGVVEENEAAKDQQEGKPVDTLADPAASVVSERIAELQAVEEKTDEIDKVAKEDYAINPGDITKINSPELYNKLLNNYHLEGRPRMVSLRGGQTYQAIQVVGGKMLFRPVVNQGFENYSSRS